MTTDAAPTRLRVLPSLARLPVAVTAGLVWLPTMVWLATVPARIRDAHLDRLVTGEGLLSFWLGLTLLAIGVLLGIAHWLSVLAHGNRKKAARLVMAVRILSWTAYLVVFSAAIWIEGTWGRECWRTCEPFPN
jgi:hypothetical protein